MSMGWQRWLILSTAITLAGCFQQAGDSLQSTGNTAVPIQNNTTIIASPTSASSPTPIILATAGPGTATLPPITIIVPPTDTPGIAGPTETPGGETSAQTGPTATGPGFITPGSPLGPSVATETPSHEATATPSGLITPTSLFESGQSANFNPECTYTVERGDTVYRIAVANGTTVDAMRAANPDLVGDNPVIHPGQVLNLPDCNQNSETSTDNTQVVQSTATDIPPIITPAGGEPPTTAPIGQTYTVQRGDTLYSIAQRFGVTVTAIVEANNLANPDRLNVGDELTIPQPPGNG